MARKKITIDLNGGDAVSAHGDLEFQFYDADDSDSIITTANFAAVGSENTPGTDSANLTFDLTDDVMVIDGVDVGDATNIKVATKDEAGNVSTLSTAVSQSSDTLIYQSDFSTGNDFTIVGGSDSLAVVSDKLVLTNPSGVSKISISLSNSVFTPSGNFEDTETYRAEVDVDVHDAKYTLFQWSYPTSPAAPAAKALSTGTNTETRTGMTSGSLQFSFDKAGGDAAAFAGETVTISEVRIYQE